MESLESRRLFTSVTVDLDGDHRVGFGDFLRLSAAYGTDDFSADLDGDFTVGFSDFLILSANFGATLVEYRALSSLIPQLDAPQEAVVESLEQWNALMALTQPSDPPSDPPVSLGDNRLAYVSIGRTGLGEWVEVEWVAQRSDAVEIVYRSYLGGVQPPDGTHVPNAMIALPKLDLPIEFRRLPELALP